MAGGARNKAGLVLGLHRRLIELTANAYSIDWATVHRTLQAKEACQERQGNASSKDVLRDERHCGGITAAIHAQIQQRTRLRHHLDWGSKKLYQHKEALQARFLAASDCTHYPRLAGCRSCRMWRVSRRTDLTCLALLLECCGGPFKH